MYLLMRKTQRDDGWVWSSMTFILEVRLDLDDDEQELFDQYGLRKLIVYDSQALQDAAQAADEHREALHAERPKLPHDASITDQVVNDFSNVTSAIYHTFAALGHDLYSWLTLQITLGSLVDGQVIESQNLEEILTIADLIRQAAEYTAGYFKLALEFDDREELSEHG
jgi:hypothetical protein